MTRTVLNFVTFFDSRFLIQGTVAVASFLRQNENASGVIYCTNTFTAEILKERFGDLRTNIRNLSEVPSIEEARERMSHERNPIEVLLALKPLLILETLKGLPKDALLAYFDADLFFYQSLDTTIRDLKDANILLTRHLFPSQLSISVKYGIVNAGFLLVRNTIEATAIVSDWAKKCRAWCFLRLEEEKYADQLYLNDYLSLPRVKSVSDPGINNGVYYFQQKRKITKASETVYIESKKLICFHFHGIRITRYSIFSGFNRYSLPKRAIRVWFYVYRNYIREIKVELNGYMMPIKVNNLQEEVFFPSSKTGCRPLQILRRTVVLHRNFLNPKWRCPSRLSNIQFPPPP